jgi:hypothetical protein
VFFNQAKMFVSGSSRRYLPPFYVTERAETESIRGRNVTTKRVDSLSKIPHTTWANTGDWIGCWGMIGGISGVGKVIRHYKEHSKDLYDILVYIGSEDIFSFLTPKENITGGEILKGRELGSTCLVEIHSIDKFNELKEKFTKLDEKLSLLLTAKNSTPVTSAKTTQKLNKKQQEDEEGVCTKKIKKDKIKEKVN